MIAQNARIVGNMNISIVQKYRYFYSGLAVKNGDGKFSQIQIILFCETVIQSAMKKMQIWFGIL